MSDHQVLGKEGEVLAHAFLKRKGYVIRERNFRTRYGEIDLIAEEGDEIVFVEVKTRRSGDFGRPEEAVGKRKQAHMVKAALQYLKLRNAFSRNIRFDVLTIGPEPGKIELLRAAFNAPATYTF